MRKLWLGAIGAMLVTALPVSVMAQARPNPPQKEETKQDKDRQGQKPGQNHGSQNQGSKKPGSSNQNNAPAKNNAPYGEWKSAWGKAPPAPPKHWSKKGDWHRHVRACQQRYKSYNSRTDTFRTNAGRNVRCTL